MVFTDMLGGSPCVGKSPVPKHLNHVDNIYNGMLVSESTSSLLSESPDGVKSKQCHLQGRSLSECSVDSEDSFIVFHGSPGTLKFDWDDVEDTDSSSDEDDMCFIQDSDCESSECDSESNESDSDVEGDNDDDDTIEDSCDGCSQSVEEVNQRWQLENPPSAHNRKSDVLCKKVCFAPPETLQTVHTMIAWDFAYRASRVGPWEQMARDRDRFIKRINRMEQILAPVLSSTHRKRMLERRDELAPSVD